jgi:hypothetical protein
MGNDDERVHAPSAGIFGTPTAEMWFRKLGVDPWFHDRDELVKVVHAVSRSYAAMERQKRVGWHGVGPDSYANRVNRIVEGMRDGVLLSDLYEDDELCRFEMLMMWDDVIATLTHKTNTPTRPTRIGLMTQLQWARLDQAADNGERAGRALADEVGIARSSIDNLYRLYDRAGRLGAHRLN